MLADFLPLKYEGVPRVSEILKNSEYFAWKCRKYSKWHQVQADRGDPQRLHRMADLLLQDNKLSVQDFAAVSAIWEKVQRWRSDKEHLAIEPPRRKAWERLNGVLKLARQDPRIVLSKLREQGIQIGEDMDTVTARFLLIELAEFATSSSIPEGVSPKNKSFVSSSAEELKSLANQLCENIYAECAVKWHREDSALQAANRILKDIDVGIFPTLELDQTLGELVNENIIPDTVLEYSELEPERLLRVTFVQGVTLVCVNNRHPLVRSLDDQDGRHVAELIFRAIGKTVADIAAEEHCADDFLAYLGLHTTLEHKKGKIETL